MGKIAIFMKNFHDFSTQIGAFPIESLNSNRYHSNVYYLGDFHG
jgi:hypothetical protein